MEFYSADIEMLMSGWNTLYKGLIYSFGGAGSSNTFTGAGVEGGEIVLEGSNPLLFEDFRTVGSAFEAGVIATFAAGGAIN
jgi:hypothetical protein